MSRAPIDSTASAALLALAALVALGGCASLLPPAGQTAPPTLELPASTLASVPVATDWWTTFNDPALNALVAEALQNNRDLARAVARIDESRALLALSRSESQPSLTATVSGSRQRITETGSPLQGGSPTSSTYRARINADYEIDLWSRLAKASAAARAELLAATTTRDGLYGAIAAQVVQAYASLQAQDAQRQLFGSAVEVQRESLGLQRLRLNAGDIGELDLRQLEGELATNEAQLPRLDRARGESERALAVLLGRSPRALIEQAVARAPQPVAPPTVLAVPAGLPSDLLQHRPDVRAAEARLAAAGARVDVARAAYFPRIALSASLGQESSDLSRLFDGPSLIWNLLASATQPIWGGGRLRAQSDAERARERIAELDYRDSVANAFSDARNALGARSETAESLRLAEQRASALTRAAELTRLRHNGGESSRLQLIEAERAALSAQAQVADARRAVIAAQADLYRALGGGWSTALLAERR
ncbi:MAG: efflux transporter outer membrane subunit [Pseudomonadota bacterium]